jgi:hypothetical protein
MADLKTQICTLLNIKDLNSIPESYIETMYKHIIKLNKKLSIRKEVAIKIDTTTEKYKVLLKFINKILANLKCNLIKNLREFKNIDRLEIIKKENVESFTLMATDLYLHFNKDTCGYYKKDSPNIVILAVRGMCKELGLLFSSEKKNIQVNTIQKTHMMYSIT